MPSSDYSVHWRPLQGMHPQSMRVGLSLAGDERCVGQVAVQPAGIDSGPGPAVHTNFASPCSMSPNEMHCRPVAEPVSHRQAAVMLSAARKHCDLNCHVSESSRAFQGTGGLTKERCSAHRVCSHAGERG